MILTNRSAWSLRGFAVVVAAALAPAIAGCEAGANAPTQQWHQPTAGASAVVNNTIRINNVFVLGAAPDSSLTPGGSAGMFLALANNGTPDRLIAIAAPGTATAVQLPAGGGGPGSGGPSGGTGSAGPGTCSRCELVTGRGLVSDWQIIAGEEGFDETVQGGGVHVPGDDRHPGGVTGGGGGCGAGQAARPPGRLGRPRTLGA